MHTLILAGTSILAIAPSAQVTEHDWGWETPGARWPSNAGVAVAEVESLPAGCAPGWSYDGESFEAARLPLEQRRQEIIGAARVKYFAVAEGGTTLDIGGGVIVPVSTRERPVLMLERGLSRMGRLSQGTMPVVTTAGQPVNLTPPLAEAMLAAVEDHIAACEARQHEIVAAALAAEDHGDLDDAEAGLATGWPSNG